MKAGNVTFYFASLHVPDESLFALEHLKDLAREAVCRLKFKIRRMLTCNYEAGKNAYTVVVFLNESHLLLTCYPEKKLLELEFASCKEVKLGDFVGWLSNLQFPRITSEFGIDKDDKGQWTRSL